MSKKMIIELNVTTTYRFDDELDYYKFCEKTEVPSVKCTELFWEQLYYQKASTYVPKVEEQDIFKKVKVSAEAVVLDW